MKEADMEKLARIMIDAVNYREEKDKIAELRSEVENLCRTFPVPAIK
jgi:glycine/serine hydroxymethyltransferase